MKPATSPRVFVGTDFILDEVLDQISDALAARGIEVVRGPRAQAGNKPVYSHAEYFPLVNRADIILVTTRFKVPPAMLDAAPRLRGVVFPSIGVDTLDIDDASRRGLIVAHGPTPENFIAMAESTVMLMVTLMLEVQSKERELRQSLPRPAMPSARMLSGKTIGIIGYGRIGLAVAERLAGWGVRLIVHDPHIDASALPPYVSAVDLPALLRESDVVSLHVVLNEETRHMIGAAELRVMKPSAFLINTARGPVVDEVALHRALAERWIQGAAIDVFEVEPLPADSPLRELDNVILTNHCVGHTREIYESLVPAAVENVTRILAGQPPLYPKNLEVLPAWQARLKELA